MQRIKNPTYNKKNPVLSKDKKHCKHHYTRVSSRNFNKNHKTHYISRRNVVSKIFPSADEALKASNLKNGDTLLVGGFGLCGMLLKMYLLMVI